MFVLLTRTVNYDKNYVVRHCCTNPQIQFNTGSIFHKVLSRILIWGTEYNFAVKLLVQIRILKVLENIREADCPDWSVFWSRHITAHGRGLPFPAFPFVSLRHRRDRVLGKAWVLFPRWLIVPKYDVRSFLIPHVKCLNIQDPYFIWQVWFVTPPRVWVAGWDGHVNTM
jgi:hypothetical protein